MHVWATKFQAGLHCLSKIHFQKTPLNIIFHWLVNYYYTTCFKHVAPFPCLVALGAVGDFSFCDPEVPSQVSWPLYEDCCLECTVSTKRREGQQRQQMQLYQAWLPTSTSLLFPWGLLKIKRIPSRLLGVSCCWEGVLRLRAVPIFFRRVRREAKK